MKQRVQAVICRQYGSPRHLQVVQVPKPQPRSNEILVKVKASNVTAADTMMRRAKPFISRFFLGFLRPNKAIIGTGFAGVIEAVGESVTKFSVGEAVFGETGTEFGANAEYLCIAEEAMVLAKPDNLPFEEAACIGDGIITSYNFLCNLAKLQAGQHVLINGASGSLGLAAIQIAHYYGAEVTAVCSAANATLVKALGATQVIDYQQYNIYDTQRPYDLIYDCVGKLSFPKARRLLQKDGLFLSPVLGFSLLLHMVQSQLLGGKKAVFSATGLLKAEQLRAFTRELLAIIAAGKLQIVIDRRYPLSQTAEGHRYVDSGRKVGNVVLEI